MCNGWDSTGEKEPLGSSFCKRKQPRSCCSPGLLSLAGLGLGERIDAGLPLLGKTVAQGATGKLGRPGQPLRHIEPAGEHGIGFLSLHDACPGGFRVLSLRGG